MAVPLDFLVDELATLFGRMLFALSLLLGLGRFVERRLGHSLCNLSPPHTQRPQHSTHTANGSSEKDRFLRCRLMAKDGKEQEGELYEGGAIKSAARQIITDTSGARRVLLQNAHG